jgi:hypothetical protein
LSMTMTAAVPRPERSLPASRNPSGVSMICSAGTQRHRRAAGDDGQQIVPAAAHAAAMRSISSRKGMPIASSTLHGLFTWPETQNSLVPTLLAAEGREPGRAAPQDGRRDRDRLDVVDRGRAAVEAHIRRERRLQARLALLALEAFEQRGFLAADIGAGAVMDVDVEIPAVDVVLADQRAS